MVHGFWLELLANSMFPGVTAANSSACWCACLMFAFCSVFFLMLSRQRSSWSSLCFDVSANYALFASSHYVTFVFDLACFKGRSKIMFGSRRRRGEKASVVSSHHQLSTSSHARISCHVSSHHCSHICPSLFWPLACVATVSPQ